jgi:sugar phosphate permease
MQEQRNMKLADESDDEVEQNFTFLQKLVIFFDLNLLKDFSYINIMVGITIANFAELNFSVLTPFVLSDFGLQKNQIAFCMSLLGIADIICRLLVPFVSTYTSLNKLQNRTLFLIGVCSMALGRVCEFIFVDLMIKIKIYYSFFSSHTFSFILRSACDFCVDRVWKGIENGVHGTLHPFTCPTG